MSSFPRQRRRAHPLSLPSPLSPPCRRPAPLPARHLLQHRHRPFLARTTVVRLPPYRGFEAILAAMTLRPLGAVRSSPSPPQDPVRWSNNFMSSPPGWLRAASCLLVCGPHIWPSGTRPVGTAYSPSIWPGTVADGPRAARYGGQAVPWAATPAHGPARARPD